MPKPLRRPTAGRPKLWASSSLEERKPLRAIDARNPRQKKLGRSLESQHDLGWR
jgi:hypothetical protein